MEVDVPVVAVAIAALPVVALLLAVVTRMESSLFGNGLLDDARLRDQYLADQYADQYVDQLADQLADQPGQVSA